MTILISILTLYPWILVAGLILILVLIARFYQKKYAELYKQEPGQQTFSALFAVPLILFCIAAGRYLLAHDFVGDLIGDTAFFVGGVTLAVLAYRLQRLMTGGRQ
jgi:hypothetical protein